jgi:CDP-diacylglycerol--serine O-phosphatidyltransferase
MDKILQHILIVVVPLVLANTLHMILVKLSWLNRINIPIYDKLFGRNKTWRGFVFLIVSNAFLVFLMTQLFAIPIKNAVLLGAILGFTYLLFELPNSFMKRKLGISPGEKHQRYRFFFSWVDKSDSALGLSLVYFLLGYVEWKMAIILFFICSATHIVSSLILVGLKIKSSF